MHVAVADAPSQWRLGKVLDRNRKKLTDTLNRTPAELTAAQHLVSSANDAFPNSSRLFAVAKDWTTRRARLISPPDETEGIRQSRGGY
jgi:hypothetical protein